MKVYRLTVDNHFRNPFRWGRCPLNIGDVRAYGIYISYGEMMPTTIEKRWFICFYFYKWFYAFSNYTQK